MADLLSGLNGFLGSMNFGNPIGLATNLALSTIVGGAVILIIAEIFAKKFSEEIKPTHAFMVSFASSLISIFGVVPLLGQFMAMVPYLGILVAVLPILVWIALIKLFFSELSLVHALLLGVVCYFLSIWVIPLVIGMVAGFIPAV